MKSILNRAGVAFVVLAGTVVGSGISVGCGGDSSSSTTSSGTGCETDTDCKGGRVCVQQECVDPGTAGSSSSGGAGAGGSAASSSGGAATGGASTGGTGATSGSGGQGGTAGAGAGGSGGAGAGGSGGAGAGGSGGAGAGGSGGAGAGGSGGAGAGGSGGGASGPPITATDDEWTWVPFPEAKCRDGSETGIGIKPSSTSDKVMIFLEGGGACFNFTTCLANSGSFGASSFNSWKDNGGTRGVFDQDNSGNPFQDWTQIYVPYCTGDVHAGANPNGNVGGAQQFVGYSNMTKFLNRIVPTFPNASRALLTGVSAGGFGAAANYEQASRMFGSVPVDLLDDSGPPMTTNYVPECLQKLFRETWNLDATVLADCTTCNNPDDFLIDLFEFYLTTHTDRQIGLIESTQDSVIRTFYGYGANNCSTFIGNMSAQDFEAGLAEARGIAQIHNNFSSFMFTGTDHTSLGGGSFYSRQVGGTSLNDWVTSFLAGTAPEVGP